MEVGEERRGVLSRLPSIRGSDPGVYFFTTLDFFLTGGLTIFHFPPLHTFRCFLPGGFLVIWEVFFSHR